MPEFSHKVNDLFRFINVRSGRPAREALPRVMRPTSGSGTYIPLYAQIIDVLNDPEIEKRADRLSEIGVLLESFAENAEVFIDSESLLPDETKGYREFAEWLSLNYKETNYESLTAIKSKFDCTTLTSSQRFIIWDNLIYRAFKGGNHPITSILIECLRIDNVFSVLASLSAPDRTPEIIAELAMAKIYLPATIFHSSLFTPDPSEGVVPEEEVDPLAEIIAAYTLHTGLHAALRERQEYKIYRTLNPIEGAPTLDSNVLEEDDYDYITIEQKEALSNLGVDIGDTFDYAFKRVGAKEDKLLSAYRQNKPKQKAYVVGGAVMMKGSLINTSVESHSAWSPEPVDPYDGFFFQDGCTIKPIGYGDLMVVRQTDVCYKAGEIAHIENLMPGEKKVVTNRTLERKETTTVVETEESTESMKESETRDRFEMQLETNRAVQQSQNFQAGVNVTYHGGVEVNANASYGSSSSVSNSINNAITSAKETVNRALDVIFKRKLENRTVKIIREFEKLSEHTLDNVGNTEPVVGIYRWVDKVYTNELWNYGRRLMFEFMIPEPAAWYLDAMKDELENAKLDLPTPPVAPDENTDAVPGVSGLQLASDITDANYLHWAAAYQISVDAPPVAFQTISDPISAKKQEDGFAIDKTLEIPEGYRAIAAKISLVQDNKGQQDATVTIGYNIPIVNASPEFSGTSGISGTLFGGTNGLSYVGKSQGLGNPVALGSGSFMAFPVSKTAVALVGKSDYASAIINVICQRLESKYVEWQQSVYSAIWAAYKQKLVEWQSAVEDLQSKNAASKSVQLYSIEGRNPERNREIEQTELRKHALRMLVKVPEIFLGYPNQFYKDGSDAQNLEFSKCDAITQGDTVRFMEQCFEWPLMTYLLYPYFHGRRSQWKELFRLDDPDPKFRQFIQAGYARVLVPVRRGFEEAALYFLSTGHPWLGAEAPSIDHPLFLSLADEMRFADDLENLPDAGPIATWKSKLPTNFILLQDGSDLAPASPFCPD